jgi:hypothetical protein
MENKAKVVARIWGGLGNQLFCYAAARRLAIANDAELVLDHVTGFKHDQVYKRQYQLDHFNIPCRKATSAERLEPLARLRHYLIKKGNQCINFEARRYIAQSGNDFDPRLLTLKVRDVTYLVGYWQSEDYFNDVADTIRAELRIQPPLDEANMSMANAISVKSAVAVHFRFFDTQEKATEHNASEHYYVRAVKHMQKLVPDAHFFVFSDRPDLARARMVLPDHCMTLVHHNKEDSNSYADLWLMSQCQHFIIANSTFSWWGAWLAQFSDKQIIAPKFTIDHPERITSWNFIGQIPNQWIKL